MIKLKRFPFLMLLALILLDFPIMARNAKMSQDVLLQPVHKDTPYFKRAEEHKYGNFYLIKMVKIRGNDQFAYLPETQANVLYYGEITLGIPGRSHGVLIDFEGKEKLFWIDSDADKDYAEETCYKIFRSDRHPGANIYYSPSPVSLQAEFDFNGSKFQIPVQFDLPFLAVARIGYADLFFLSTRTWFTGIIDIENKELRVALVDTNDNGSYQDPEDLIFLDKDYDFNFTPAEGRPLKKTKSIKLNSGRWNILYDYAPAKLILEER